MLQLFTMFGRYSSIIIFLNVSRDMTNEQRFTITTHHSNHSPCASRCCHNIVEHVSLPSVRGLSPLLLARQTRLNIFSTKMTLTKKHPRAQTAPQGMGVIRLPSNAAPTFPLTLWLVRTFFVLSESLTWSIDWTIKHQIYRWRFFSCLHESFLT